MSRPAWECMHENVPPGKSWFDVLRRRGVEGWAAWHMERDEHGWCSLYFKRIATPTCAVSEEEAARAGGQPGAATRELLWDVTISWEDDHGPCTVSTSVWVPESDGALGAVTRAVQQRGASLSRATHIEVRRGHHLMERTIQP